MQRWNNERPSYILLSSLNDSFFPIQSQLKETNEFNQNWFCLLIESFESENIEIWFERFLQSIKQILRNVNNGKCGL